MDMVPNEKSSELVEPSKRSKLLLVILLATAVIGAGVFAYLWQGQVSEVATQRQASDSAQSKVVSLKAQLESEQKSGVAEQPSIANDNVTTQSDEAMVVAMVGAYGHLNKGSENTKLDIQVTKKELPFARATVMTEDGGYACVLKKSDALWVVLFCGQGTPLQDKLDAWGVPNSMLTS